MKKTMKLTQIGLLVAGICASGSLLAEPNITISTSTTSRDFPISAEQPLVVPLNKEQYIFKVTGVEGECSAPDEQKVRFNRPLGINCGTDTELPFNIRFAGDYAITYDDQAQTISVKRQPKKAAKKEFVRPIPQVTCEVFTDKPVSINVAGTFQDGTKLIESFSGQAAVVKDGKVSLKPSRSNGGVMLLEKAGSEPNNDKALDWRNANIYFVMVDRFNNGDSSNDQSYGRQKDGKEEIGTFHGGDLKGVIEKLDYIQSLGTDAIWLSPIVEQVHGFVGGGNKVHSRSTPITATGHGTSPRLTKTLVMTKT